MASGNPELYRHLALYLQVLRNVLPGRVQQACFHLATQVHAQRYLNLPASRRLELQRLIQERVQQCCTLLTVEQLAAQARVLEREQQNLRGRRQRKLLQRLLTQAENEGEGVETADSQNAEPSSEEVPAEPPPPGSVRLALSPPVDPAVLGWSIPSGWGASPAGWPLQRDGRPDPTAPDDGEDWPDEDSGEAEEEHNDPEPPDARDGQAGGSGSQDQQDADAAALMMALMQGLLGDREIPPDHEQDGAVQVAGPREAPLAQASGSSVPMGLLAEPVDRSAALAGDASTTPSPWDDASLPQDPVQLLRWLDGLDQALVRRLRDLSHAINADLLRLGLSRGLLPVSLLEAVVNGQIETLSSPANVLRLQLPFGLSPGAPPLQALAILLRPADLEMEEPRLRTCRRRIHQHRQQVRKMAETYRRLQRRLQAHEAERLWLQDIRASHDRGS